MTESENAAIGYAWNVLKHAIQTDHTYAWHWHCAIAASAYVPEEWRGLEEWMHRAANEVAARVMRNIFHVDTATFEEYLLVMDSRDVEC